MQIVVRSESDRARMPLVGEPIDFEREMALVVTLGRVVSERYSVRVTRVWRQGPKLRVEIETAPPPEGSPITYATPFCVAVVPRCDLNVAGFEAGPPRTKQ